MLSGLSVVMVEKAVSTMSVMELKLARPGMQPSQAHDPNETMILDFLRRSLATCSFSSLRMPPLNRHRVISPSSIFSTSEYLASMATGQKTTSNAASTSRIFSWIFRTAISQPPQEAAQYMANFGLLMRAPPQPELQREAA